VFETMIFILVTSFWFTLVIGFITTIFLRMMMILKDKYQNKEKYLILFSPFAYGVLKYAKPTIYKKIYKIVIIVFFITGFIASLLILYSRLGIGVY